MTGVHASWFDNVIDKAGTARHNYKNNSPCVGKNITSLSCRSFVFHVGDRIFTSRAHESRLMLATTMGLFFVFCHIGHVLHEFRISRKIIAYHEHQLSLLIGFNIYPLFKLTHMIVRWEARPVFGPLSHR